MNEGDPNDSMDSTERLSHLEESLRKGVLASREIVKTRGRASRIQDTLDRISNTATAILSALRPFNQSALFGTGQRAIHIEQPVYNDQQSLTRVEPQVSRTSRSSAAHSGGYGSQQMQPEVAGGHGMDDGLARLLSGEVDFFESLGDISFDFNDFTAL